MNEKIQKSILAVILVLVLGAAAVVFVRMADDDSLIQQSSQTVQDVASGDEGVDSDSSGEDISERAEITLEAVNDYQGTATATRMLVDGDYVHEVMAEIGDPAEGKFYEGWIVGAEIVSTGKMEKEGEGMYSLVYEGEARLIDFDRVVITEETEANGLDGIPETHVFEGDF